MNTFLSANYWTERYQNNQAGWDLGQVSPPIKAYIDQLEDKDLRILIPGCGSGYEGAYLWEKGFKNVHLLDFSSEPIAKFKRENSNFPKEQLHCGDFFEHIGEYDLIIEQTLFCAIDPSLRANYAIQSARLLKKGGKLVGLLFDRNFEAGPPFGGSEEEYKRYFELHFSQLQFDPCYNSIPPRQGSELFIKFRK